MKSVCGVCAGKLMIQPIQGTYLSGLDHLLEAENNCLRRYIQYKISENSKTADKRYKRATFSIYKIADLASSIHYDQGSLTQCLNCQQVSVCCEQDQCRADQNSKAQQWCHPIVVGRSTDKAVALITSKGLTELLNLDSITRILGDSILMLIFLEYVGLRQSYPLSWTKTKEDRLMCIWQCPKCETGYAWQDDYLGSVPLALFGF